jgi:hypothetical protein
VKRGVALIASTLVLGACGSSAANGPPFHGHGPAVHARVRGPGSDLDVWRDGKGRITFIYRPSRKSPIEIGIPTPSIWRFDPSTRMVTALYSTRAAVSTRYQSERNAWAAIDEHLGVTKSKVMRALALGSASPEPVGYRVPAPLTSSTNYAVYTNYGKNIARMAKELRLTLPRLASLGGHPFSEATTGGRGPHNPAVFLFPAYTYSDNAVYMVVHARGTESQQLRHSFDGARRHHRAAGTPYAVVDGSVIFPYHGEWISVDDADIGNQVVSGTHASLVREIVTAPTAG